MIPPLSSAFSRTHGHPVYPTSRSLAVLRPRMHPATGRRPGRHSCPPQSKIAGLVCCPRPHFHVLLQDDATPGLPRHCHRFRFWRHALSGAAGFYSVSRQRGLVDDQVAQVSASSLNRVLKLGLALVRRCSTIFRVGGQDRYLGCYVALVRRAFPTKILSNSRHVYVLVTRHRHHRFNVP